MCGIAGIFDLRGTREPDRAALRRMTDALGHRGPDGQGAHVEPGVALGHRRLAVIDPGAGAQPFTSQGGKTVLTFNGEVYDHRRLGAQVERAGRRLRTSCDTEVLAELLDMRGADALAEVRGMFAFAAWNPREETLLLARDRFGEKPLYYAQTRDGLLVFASEMGAILASGLVEPVVSPTAVADYLFGRGARPRGRRRSRRGGRGSDRTGRRRARARGKGAGPASLIVRERSGGGPAPRGEGRGRGAPSLIVPSSHAVTFNPAASTPGRRPCCAAPARPRGRPPGAA